MHFRELIMAIAKMKRLFLVGPSDLKEKTMTLLQEIGAVHVEPAAKLAGEMEKRYGAIQQQAKKIIQIREGMSRFKKQKGSSPPRISDDELLTFCESRLVELQELQSRKQNLQKLINDLKVWGDFDPQALNDLEESGTYIQRFRMEGKMPADFTFPENVHVEVISEKPSFNFFTVSTGKPVQISQAIQLRPPEMGLRQALTELDKMQNREKEINEECGSMYDRIELLGRMYNNIVNEASYTESLGTLYLEGHIFGLQGWIPEDDEDSIIRNIEASGFPLIVTTRDPSEDETPPTLFKNNWFVNRIEPLLKLYGLPDYRSLDPSIFFAPFMILFFGICLGDAGYGFVFLLASVWIKKKWGHLSKELPAVMNLCQLFSISAILFGVITGSVFGYEFKTKNWVLIDIGLETGNPMILFYASLGLGLLHLSFSYILGMLDAKSRNEVLQKLGLMLVLWGGSSIIIQNIWFSNPLSNLGAIFKFTGVGLLSLGLIFTFFSASDSKNIGVRIGLGFWNIYGLTGLVSDLLSYARLFGLGIATTAIAGVMNQLAGMVYGATGPVIGGVLSVLLLLLGHTFNLALSILGSTVHSARLHFVEAFRSFFRGGGIEYKPFKIERG